VVERGVEVMGLDGREDRVLVRFAEGSELAVQWLVGAGGAHSVVRSSLDAPLEGSTYPGTALVADVGLRCPLPRDPRPPGVPGCVPTRSRGRDRRA
jgi:6-methylpretetramide 4-monooxygenase / 4-hydroxy-6-methylpretetramide 12a-monooxygenase